MTNQISSPFADYIQEQKKQKQENIKNKNKINVFNIASYEIESYSLRLRLKNSIYQTLLKNDGKIINKKLLEQINKNINLLLPYEKYGYVAYHQKPESIIDDNRIYIYTHRSGKDIIKIDKFEADIILQESANRRNTETISKCIKINKEEIKNNNEDSLDTLLKNLQYWQNLRNSSYEIQYAIDEIKDKTTVLTDRLESNFNIRSFSILELVNKYPKINSTMEQYIIDNYSS